MMRWFAERRLTVEEAKELFAWSKTYIERHYMVPNASGTSIPGIIKTLWECIHNRRIDTKYNVLGETWERRKPKMHKALTGYGANLEFKKKTNAAPTPATATPIVSSSSPVVIKETDEEMENMS
ncbi:unnamed protein product [Peniophora sp. CBMAI 1063]|nr:unnamed protein product [Peniophora sp. CBMAI 1063]